MKLTESDRDDPKKSEAEGTRDEDVLQTETGGDGLKPQFRAVNAKEAGGVLDDNVRHANVAGGLGRDGGVSGGLEP